MRSQARLVVVTESILASHSSKELTITTLNSQATPTIVRQVLVVDDNVASAETLALLIGLSGHQTQVAHTGAAALAMAETFRPDIVLLDIGLPGMDGYEVARQLRQSEATGATLLVAVTGYGQDDDRNKTAAAGFHHHLVKPVDMDQLEKILQVGRVPASG